MPREEKDFSSGTDLLDKIQVKKPSNYVVIMHNDHYTTMDFVIEILMSVFNKNRAEATKIMLDVHQKGAGIAGIYAREIAETKAQMANEKSRAAGFPLKCSIEKE